MATNWRDVQDKATAFVLEHRGASKEDSEAKAFWVRFFDIFGVRERSVGLFEKRVKLLKGGDGKIDFFAPGRFMIEHKSLDKDLDKAFKQAAEYIDALPEDEKPRYLILCDFDTFRLYDFESKTEKRGETEFKLKDLPSKVQLFAFLTQSEVQVYKEEDPINVKAVRAIGRLYEAVRRTNHFTPQEASKFLTRLVFCFFADDTGIFNHNSMRRYIEENTKEDGTDVGAHIGQMFQVLDMDNGTGGKNERPETLHPMLADLPYVNGGLFGADMKALFGSREIRDELITCMTFDWSRISPEIFGSMFQSVMDDKERHDLGAHYTSEINIRKVIDGLFLDEIKAELEAAKSNEARLNALWDKIAAITLLDPACGCGNFLVVSYKELRRIENEIIARLHGRADKRSLAHAESGHARLDLGEVDLATISRLSVERMHGIELEAFAAEVAKLSLWVVDHMMNVELGAIFGKPHKKLPLREAPHIVEGNALRLDWESVVPKDKLTYILGNPPFLGKKEQDPEQKKDMETVWGAEKGAGILDYVSCWYKKAADMIAGTHIKVAFVSTNSITQGEQVGVLWPYLLKKGIKIHFAHRTFKWSNEARGKAAVHCVIVGFADFDIEKKSLSTYEDIGGEPHTIQTSNINPYLVDAPDVVVTSRTKPIAAAPKINYGSMPIDEGGLILTASDAQNIRNTCPAAQQFVRPYIGGDEFLNGETRYCLWLKDAGPETIRSCEPIRIRVESVRAFRMRSGRETTKKLAGTPYLFGEIRQPSSKYLVVPKVSSENREYMPLGIVSQDVIANGSVLVIPDCGTYELGVLSSAMHMAWMRAVAGRLESRYQYSAGIVYNNFPWPEKPSEEQKREVEAAAQAVLDARAAHPGATLADLYDPAAMPADLLKAHHRLDKAVDARYGRKNFKSEPERLEFLFERYRALIS